MSYQWQGVVAAVIAFALVLITGFAIVAIFLIPIPSGNESLVGQAVGTLLALVGIIVTFFYSTSSGNRKDSDTIATLVETSKTVAQNANPAPDVALKPGQNVTVEATDAPETPR